MMRMVAVAAGALGMAASEAHPEAPPWGRSPGEDCDACHFSESAREQSPSLTLRGLPVKAMTGQRYELVARLEDPQMRRAGVRVIITTDRGSPGTLETVDGRLESDGDRIRSTVAGTELGAPGIGEWRFVWRAPEVLSGPIEFAVHANAANDDDSALGDVIHRHSFSVGPLAR